MKEKETFLDYLKDITEAISNIWKFVDKMDYASFEQDVKTQYAVVRALEIIGEATKKSLLKFAMIIPGYPGN